MCYFLLTGRDRRLCTLELQTAYYIEERVTELFNPGTGLLAIGVYIVMKILLHEIVYLYKLYYSEYNMACV